MKRAGWGAAGLIGAVLFVVGLVLGGLGPRAEVRRLQDRVFALERDAARRPSAVTEGLRDLILNPAERRVPSPEPVARDTDTPRLRSDPARVRRTDPEIAPDAVRQDEPSTDPFDGMDPAAARDLLAMRAAQARAALFEDVSPSEAQVAELDALVDRMNDDLVRLGTDFLDRVRVGDLSPRRDGMAFGADLLDVLVTTESQMLDTLTPAQRVRVREEATDPTSFVDPRVVDLLDDLQEIELSEAFR